MKVLHLEGSELVRKRFRDLMVRAGHEVVSYRDYKLAIKDTSIYELYVVGNLNGVHGPDFALAKVMEGKKVLMLAEMQKLSRVPFVSLDALSNSRVLIRKIEEITTGGV